MILPNLQTLRSINEMHFFAQCLYCDNLIQCIMVMCMVITKVMCMLINIIQQHLTHEEVLSPFEDADISTNRLQTADKNTNNILCLWQ